MNKYNTHFQKLLFDTASPCGSNVWDVANQIIDLDLHKGYMNELVYHEPVQAIDFVQAAIKQLLGYGFDLSIHENSNNKDIDDLVAWLTPTTIKASTGSGGFGTWSIEALNS